MNTVTVKTFDGRLHFYQNFTVNEVVKFLTDKGMIRKDTPINNNEFKIIN